VSGGETPDGDARDARAMLDAWRRRGADRLDPVRFHFIEALERRAAGHGGKARRILDDRLAGLLEAYSNDLDSAAGKAGEAALAASSCEPADGALAALTEHIACGIARRSTAGGDGPAASSAPLRRSAYPELEALDYFRETWSRLSTDRQVRQSLAQVPDNAGPLNSNSLVHRSLALMRELSPAYLRQFLSYVDGLSWMEQMTAGGAPAGKEAPRTGSARTSARGKSR
jgi:hypothetical protein